MLEHPSDIDLTLVRGASVAEARRLLAGIAALELAPGQDEFVGEPQYLSALAMAHADRHLFVVESAAGTGVVGMGVLHFGGAADVGQNDVLSAVLLRGFLIDHRHQGLGYGSKATAAAFELARALAAELQPTATGLVLGVNESNAAGFAAYRKAGFADVGVYRGGRTGPQRVMRRQF